MCWRFRGGEEWVHSFERLSWKGEEQRDQVPHLGKCLLSEVGRGTCEIETGSKGEGERESEGRAIAWKIAHWLKQLHFTEFLFKFAFEQKLLQIKKCSKTNELENLLPQNSDSRIVSSENKKIKIKTCIVCTTVLQKCNLNISSFLWLNHTYFCL